MLVGFGVVLAVQHRSEASVPRLVQEHKAAPTFDLEDLTGKAISSKALAGKTYVVNFWNSWCIPCRQEQPALRTFYAAHQSEPDFEMVGIVRDDDTRARSASTWMRTPSTGRSPSTRTAARRLVSARRANPRPT